MPVFEALALMLMERFVNQELVDYLKFLAPIATFGLGVWAAPLIEARKEKAKAR